MVTMIEIETSGIEEIDPQMVKMFRMRRKRKWGESSADVK